MVSFSTTGTSSPQKPASSTTSVAPASKTPIEKNTTAVAEEVFGQPSPDQGQPVDLEDITLVIASCAKHSADLTTQVASETFAYSTDAAFAHLAEIQKKNTTS